MITLGIDLAAQPKHTGGCAIEWSAGTAAVRWVRCGMDDHSLLGAISEATRVGIDVPFGWPETFIDFVVAHRRGARLPDATTRDLRHRDTDRFVHEVTGLSPLSVSADRIGVPAFRAARLLSALAEQGASVDRDGAGKIVEAYPAAALRQWGFDATGYKGDDGREKRRALFDGLRSRAARWLAMDATACSTCYANADGFDALVAALIARAAAVGLCHAVPSPSAARAAVEGWIALPMRDSFDRLV